MEEQDSPQDAGQLAGRGQVRDGSHLLSPRAAVAAGARPLEVIADGELVREFIALEQERLSFNDKVVGSALSNFAGWLIATDPAGGKPGGRVAISAISSGQLIAWRLQISRELAPSTLAEYRKRVARHFTWLHKRGIVSSRVALSAGAAPLSLVADGDQAREIISAEQERLDSTDRPLGSALGSLARWLIATDPAGGKPGERIALSAASSEQLLAWRDQLETLLEPQPADTYRRWVAGRVSEVL